MKKGDTLIEVTIAIGIFSLVAIGVANVMSSGLAGSQNSLEATLAREEVDAQAEALRFVHAAYISNKNTYDYSSYAELWNKITKNARTTPNFKPSSCAANFDGLPDNAFVLDVRNLDNADTDRTFISSKMIGPAVTYPRLIYGASNGLVDNDASTKLTKAEGIYVVAARDQGTKIIGLGNQLTNTPAFYDFYIYTCWYGLDSETPSSISTVIRLYDPIVTPSS